MIASIVGSHCHHARANTIPVPVPVEQKFCQHNTVEGSSSDADQTKSHLYLSWMLPSPSFIKLYRISVLLFIPISKPRVIINSKSNTIVASTAVELLT